MEKEGSIVSKPLDPFQKKKIETAGLRFSNGKPNWKHPEGTEDVPADVRFGVYNALSFRRSSEHKCTFRQHQQHEVWKGEGVAEFLDPSAHTRFQTNSGQEACKCAAFNTKNKVPQQILWQFSRATSVWIFLAHLGETTGVSFANKHKVITGHDISSETGGCREGSNERKPIENQKAGRGSLHAHQGWWQAEKSHHKRSNVQSHSVAIRIHFELSFIFSITTLLSCRLDTCARLPTMFSVIQFHAQSSGLRKFSPLYDWIEIENRVNWWCLFQDKLAKGWLLFRGCVVTMECVEKLIKKDMLDPINSQPLKDADIIPLQRASVFTWDFIISTLNVSPTFAYLFSRFVTLAKNLPLSRAPLVSLDPVWISRRRRKVQRWCRNVVCCFCEFVNATNTRPSLKDALLGLEIHSKMSPRVTNDTYRSINVGVADFIQKAKASSHKIHSLSHTRGICWVMEMYRELHNSWGCYFSQARGWMDVAVTRKASHPASHCRRGQNQTRSVGSCWNWAKSTGQCTIFPAR